MAQEFLLAIGVMEEVWGLVLVLVFQEISVSVLLQ